MEELKHFKQLSFSTQLALVSFGLGTIIFLSFLAFPEEDRIIIVGLFYILLAILCNGITLFWLVYQFITKSKEREKTTIQILILMANVPIATMYSYLAISSWFHGIKY